MLEAALRLGGFISLSLQAHRNTLAMRQKGTYRIMCIGESTTQKQYPAFLEQALNGKDQGIRVSVIDRGLQAANSTFLLSRMEEDLVTYHPDMVVAMMGINDKGPHMPYEPETSSKFVRAIRTLRTHKLARIAWMHITNTGNRGGDALHSAVAGEWKTVKLKARPQPAQAQGTTGLGRNPRPSNDGSYVDLGWTYRKRGDLAKAVAAFKKALEINPRNEDAYGGLGLIFDERGEYVQAAAAFKKALEINPQNKSYVDLGWSYRKRGDLAKAVAAFKKALEIDPRNEDAYGGLGSLFNAQREYVQAAAAFKKALEINPRYVDAYTGALWACLSGRGDSSSLQYLLKKSKEYSFPTDRLYGALSTLHAAIGNLSLAQRYHKKLEQLQLNEYDQLVADNYLRLKTMLDRRGVKLVCVQYPMRGLAPLKKIFKEEEGSIIFVDNEQVFKDAVKKSSLREYFTDLFGGDFGHCTDKGNNLLAENIANVVAREVFHK